ncbi:MAG: aminoacyl-tRNA hydrolase [Oscillospiraceae bacterium]
MPYDIFEKLKNYVNPKAPSGPIEYIIVGLGNTGEKYVGTRHNIGFMAADKICGKYGITCDRLKFKALCGEGIIGGKRVLVMKPTTFMNLSGEAVVQAMQFYKLPAENTIIIFDDVSLDIGKMRIRRKGSHGGQNGIKNIIYLAGTDAFPRIKIGVGQKPHADYDLADWVLSRFTPEDMKQITPLLDDVTMALQILLTEGIDAAMSKFNS